MCEVACRAGGSLPLPAPPLPAPLRQKVEQEEVDLVFEACDMMETLNEAKLHMLKYVESRMSLIAPNLSAMVGSTVAAKLMGGSRTGTAVAASPGRPAVWADCHLLLLYQVWLADSQTSPRCQLATSW